MSAYAFKPRVVKYGNKQRERQGNLIVMNPLVFLSYANIEKLYDTKRLDYSVYKNRLSVARIELDMGKEPRYLLSELEPMVEELTLSLKELETELIRRHEIYDHLDQKEKVAKASYYGYSNSKKHQLTSGGGTTNGY